MEISMIGFVYGGLLARIRLTALQLWEHQIRDESNFEEHVDYIHYNPVKHNYVSRPIERPYSTLHRYVQREMLPENWANRIAEVTAGGGDLLGFISCSPTCRADRPERTDRRQRN